MSGMGKLGNFLDPLELFIKKDKPTVAPAPTVPAQDPTAIKAAEEQARLERARTGGGRAANMLTGPAGLAGDSSSTRKMLLGS